MDKLEAIQVFVAVAREGGFSAAARLLGMPLTNVSRKVAELERSLGVRLFERSTRQVVLTHDALSYFDSCQRLLEDLSDADRTVKGEHRTAKGKLAVTAPVGFGRQHLQPVVIEFLRAYPEIDMQLLLIDRMVDLVEEHVDVALRIGVLPDSSLVAINVGTVKMVVCAGPGYLASRGEPMHPSDLVAHDCIAWSSLRPDRGWWFTDQRDRTLFPINVRLTTTLPDSAVEAASADLGITQVTSYQAEAAVRSGALRPLLRAFEPAPTPVNLVHSGNRLVPQKLRVFLDFAAPRLRLRLDAVAALL